MHSPIIGSVEKPHYTILPHTQNIENFSHSNYSYQKANDGEWRSAPENVLNIDAHHHTFPRINHSIKVVLVGETIRSINKCS